MNLITEIQAKCSLEVLATHNPQTIANVVNVGRVKVVLRLIGIGTILATLGAAGGPFLDGLVALGSSDRNVYWAMELIKSGQLDIGMQATRDQVTTLAASMPSTAPAIMALLALAEVPDQITEFDVRCALWDVNGTWLGA